MRRSILFVIASFVVSAAVSAAMTEGAPDIKSVGSLAFGPDGILLVGDSVSGSIFAVDLDDRTPGSSAVELQVTDIDEKLAAMLGTTAKNVRIHDMAVNPISQNTYLTVSRGRGDEAVNLLIRVTPAGEISDVALKDVSYDVKMIASVVSSEKKDRRWRSLRREAITNIACVSGDVYIAGLSNEEFSSTLRVVAYSFDKKEAATSLEIFHAAHKKYETHSPIRTLLPYELQSVPHLLAAYTCTPLVTFSIDELTNGAHVKGKTVAELGSGNRPLDKVTYERDGKEYILLANRNRTMMKIDPDDIAKASAITDPIDERYGTSGVEYIAIAQVGVQQLDNLNAENVVVLQRMGNGSLNLRSLKKARL
jgi:hypothetical protein